MAIRIFWLPPHSILEPDVRWFPADEALSGSSYEKLLLPRAGLAAFGTI